jgi:hypothetical protein
MNDELFNIKDYFMGRDDSHSNELTKELKENARELVSRVNAFLDDLGIEEAKISSGWRPKSINDATPGASKTSAHLTCQAVDIKDDEDQSLCNLIKDRLDKLEEFDLYMEDPDRTKGKFTTWCHLQTRKAKNRIFKP